MGKNNFNNIDIIYILNILIQNKRSLLKTSIICFVIGTICAFSIPKEFQSSAILSPESHQLEGNGLGGMAALIGLGNTSVNNTDALNSSMFPEIIKTTPFIIDLYNTKIKPSYSYDEILLSEYVIKQKSPWWHACLTLPKQLIGYVFSLFKGEKEITTKENEINPYRLTKEQSLIINAIKESLEATIDEKSGMITVSSTFQDPDVAALITQKAILKLQDYIINYRIQKAQEDFNYLQQLAKDYQIKYYEAQEAYANFIDSNRSVIMQRTQSDGIRLQNEMNLAFQIYSQIETQLQTAKAKIQEAKPVFTIVEPASVPLRPIYPNKIIIILTFILGGLIIDSGWIIFGQQLWLILKEEFTKHSN